MLSLAKKIENQVKTDNKEKDKKDKDKDGKDKKKDNKINSELIPKQLTVDSDKTKKDKENAENKKASELLVQKVLSPIVSIVNVASEGPMTLKKSPPAGKFSYRSNLKS